MKKILLLMLMAAGFFLNSHAQIGTAFVFPTIAGDTLNNVDTVAKVITATTGYQVAGIQVNLKQLSGTVAGKVYLFQSLTGKDFVLTDSAVYTPNPTFTTTIIPLGITPLFTHAARFEKPWVPSVFYLIEAISTGTVSASVQMSYTLRKRAVIN